MPQKSFEIKISRFGPASFKADIDSPLGKTSTTFQLPLKKPVVEATLSDFRENLQQTTKLRSTLDEEYIPQVQGALTPDQIGTALFNGIFQPNVAELYQASRKQAKGEGRPLPIILNIDPNAGDLINLPWEFLCDTTARRVRSQFLAFDQDTPIIRRWLRAEELDFSYDTPLRVLLVSANPEDSTMLNVQKEHSLIQDKLTELNKGGKTRVRVEYLSGATLGKLKQIVRDSKRTPHIIHFMGHGCLGSLLLEDREGGQKSISDESMAIILKNAPSLRLVVLNACETAQADILTRQLGVAQSLADAGIPAIVAMQFLISDKAALTFAEEFYQVISEGKPIDAAVTWGRIAIQNEFADTATKEWATPVLYLQAPDGNILTDLLDEQNKPPKSTQQPSERPAPDFVAGQPEPTSTTKTEQMRREAEETTAQIEHLQKLRHQYIRRLRERELQAAKFGINVDPYITIEIADIREDINKIDKELKALDPEITFSQIVPPPSTTPPAEVAELDDSKTVRAITTDDTGIHSQGFKLYREGGLELKKGNWQVALSYLSRAQKLSPSLPDIDSVVEQARQNWQQTPEGQNEYYTLEALYDQAQHHLSQNNWERAASLLERIVCSDASYNDAYELALEARANADKERTEQEKQARLTDLFSQAQASLKAEVWSKAVEALTQVVELDSSYHDSQQLLNEAIKQQDLQEAYQQGQKHLKVGEWARAVAAFGKVASIDETYEDTAKLLALSRRQKQLDAWIQEAEDYLKKEEWDAAIEVLEDNQVAQEREEARIHLHYAYAHHYQIEPNWEQVVVHLKQIIEARPNYHPEEVNSLYHQANEELHLQQQFEKAILHMDKEEWTTAKATLEAIVQARPDYPMAQDRLEQVKEEIHKASLYERALNALEFKQWAKAISYLKDIPVEYRDTQARLAEAKQQLELETFYQEGLEAASSGRWPEAVTAFQHVLAMDETYRDVQQELQNARNKVTLEQSYNLGTAALETGQRTFDLDQLNQAVNYLEQAVDIDPRYRGVDNRLREAKRVRFLLQHYQDGEVAFQQEQWAEAIAQWQVIVKDENEPDFHNDCAQRLAQARHRQRLADLYLAANQHLQAKEWDNAITLLEELEQETQGSIYGDTYDLLSEARLQQKLAQHYNQAEQLIVAEQWERAIGHLEEIQRDRPDYRQHDVERLLVEAQTNREATRNYEAGLAALKTESWSEAVTAFDRTYKLRSDYKDVETRLRQARQQETLHNRYQIALEALNKEAWDEAIDHLVAIQGIDPDFKDARQQLEEAERQRQLAADYQTAQDHIKAERWGEACDILNDILSRQPDYKDTPVQRNEAQQQLDMSQKYEDAVNKIDQAEQQPENWQLAADSLQTVAEWQPDYRDTASLLEKAQYEAKLYSLYQRATVLGAKNEIPDLEEAINLLGQITEIDLNYRNAAPLKGEYETKLVEKKEEERRIEIRTRFNLALQSAEKGEFEQALTQLEQIIRLDEQYQPVWDSVNKHIQQCLAKYHQGQQLKADKKKTAEALAILEEYKQDKLNLPGIIQEILQRNLPE